MSLSSLEAQLAALKQKQTSSTGSTFASSKRHEDAVGRGLAYSVQHGHAILHNDKYKPSFVAETAAAAADVPFHVITEQCQDAVATLSSSTTNSGNNCYPLLARLMSPLLSSQQQQPQQPQDQDDDDDDEGATVKKSVKQTLQYIGTILTECSGAGSSRSNSDSNDDAVYYHTACLHVLEYLVRSPQLDLCNQYKYDLLWALLPATTKFPHVVSRCLELCDWAAAPSSSQSYLWLRPYTASNNNNKKNNNKSDSSSSSSTTTTVFLPPRSLMARQVMAHLDILRHVCEYTKSLAQLHEHETNSTTTRSSTAVVRRGIGYCFSFTAAIVTQGLAQLQRNQASDENTNQHAEAVLRTLLPTVCHALSTTATTNCADYCAWGMVVASTLAETMDLAPPTTQLLATKLLSMISPKAKDEAAAAAAADAVACLLSILMPRGRITTTTTEFNNNNNNNHVMLPLIHDPSKLLGCPALSEATYQLLLEQPQQLPAVLGHLYTERRMVVAPLVAQLIVNGLLKQKKQDKRRLQLVLELLQEESLKGLFKRDSRIDIVASLTAFIIARTVEEATKSKSNPSIVPIKQARKVFKTLHTVDATACQRGIAYALQEQDNDVNNEKVEKLFRGILSTANVSTQQQQHQDNKQEATTTTTKPKLLPARLALEHANADTRLQAIHSLRDTDFEKETDDGELQMTTPLTISLLLHWGTDPNADVALAACNTIGKRLEHQKMNLDNAKSARRIGELVLSACYKWISRTSSASTPNAVEFLLSSLSIAARVARQIAQLGQEDLLDIWQRLLEFIVAQLPSSFGETKNKTIHKHAAKSLFVALDHRPDRNSTQGKVAVSARKAVTQVLLESYPFLKGLQKPISSTGRSHKATEMFLHKRCVMFVLESILEKDTQDSEDELSTLLIEEALALCLMVVSQSDSSAPDLTSKEGDLVKRCFERLSLCSQTSSSAHERVPDILIKLASIESGKLLSTVLEPAIEFLATNLKDINGNSVSPLSVFLEAAHRTNAAGLAVKRLLVSATKLTAKDECTGVWLAFVPALALLEHPDDEVRAAAVDLLIASASSLPGSSSSRGRNMSLDLSCLKDISQKVSNMKTSAKIGGESFLSQFLTTCIKEVANSTKLSEALLFLCVCSAVGCGNESVRDITAASANTWLPIRDALGGCQASAVLLHAMELAGEEAFSLLSRWTGAGLPLLEAVMNSQLINDSPGLSFLMNCIGRMMKGVTISDPHVIISSGPQPGGGRARSYSVGKMDGVMLLTPYPEKMREAVVDILTKSKENDGARSLATVVVKEVIASRSWAEGVFKLLPRSGRADVVSAVLKCIDSGLPEASGDLLARLPLLVDDIVDLVGRVSLSEEAVLLEFIDENAKRLSSSPDLSELVSLLFGRLKYFSSNQNDNDDASNYLLHSVLCALVKLLNCEGKISDTLPVDKHSLQEWSSMILGLLGCKTQSSVQKLPAYRSRAVALTLLVALCSLSPEHMVSTLIPATVSAVGVFDIGAPPYRHTFSKTVPAYMNYCAYGGLSLTHLLGAFCASVAAVPKWSTKERLIYADLVDSLLLDPAADDALDDRMPRQACIGALQATYLANAAFDAKNDPVGSEEIAFAVFILERAQVSVQMTSLLLLLSYAKGLVSQLQGESTQAQQNELLPTPDDIGAFAALGPVGVNSKKDWKDWKDDLLTNSNCKKRIHSTILALLQVVSDTLVLENIRSYIKKGEGSMASLSLRMWQDMLVIQSAAQSWGQRQSQEEIQFLESLQSLVNESREYLQGILPVHVFLASVSSLIIQEGGTSDIRSRALRLVADRACSFDSTSPEAPLFVDVLVIVLEVMKNAQLCEPGLIQSALVAMDHIARALSSNDANGSDPQQTKGFAQFTLALRRCSELLQTYEVRFDASAATHDIISSILLCSATLIRTVGATCLPVLPKLMKAIISVLTSTNDHLASQNGIEDNEAQTQYRVTQLAALRALMSVVETVPQFLPSHLPSLFSESVLLSDSLRAQENSSTVPVQEALERLDTAISARVTARLFVPAISKPITQCSRVSDMNVLLFVLKSSVAQAPNSIVSSQKNMLLSSVTKAFDFDGSWDDRLSLVEAACDLLDTMVLKLSEVQLRRVFVSLREWRGEFDGGDDPELLATRRFAFWSICARLSEELRSIFLPCMTVVFDDAIAELDMAVSCLCDTRRMIALSAEGTKKRKLNASDNGIETMRALQRLLETMENVLRADALQGGTWIRGSDNRKYGDLLEPLGKLLLSRIPSDLVSNDYRSIVEGSGNYNGSVVGCLVALASAGGNEQLWKPLNHAVLQACGEEDRSEVRRAGLVCLLELMKSLGEEYMVLLPENLPVLSELLEDSNEEVATLAREIIALAEELIGESLEDSLR